MTANNRYGVEFLTFIVRDNDSKEIFFEINREPSPQPVQFQEGVDYNQYRTINYTFPTRFLDMKNISTSLVFKVGEEEALSSFRMIERHYDSEKNLIRSWDFETPFCMPGSTNGMEAEYDVPALSAELKASIINATGPGTYSDSFYFVGEEMIMHNKAFYQFAD
jgi:hypothetical protein